MRTKLGMRAPPAHAAAAKSVGILHGDLSYSNLMILPKIYKPRESAKPIVKWEGILIDWEGAQPLPSPSNHQLKGPGPDSRVCPPRNSHSESAHSKALIPCLRPWIHR